MKTVFFNQGQQKMEKKKQKCIDIDRYAKYYALQTKKQTKSRPKQTDWSHQPNASWEKYSIRNCGPIYRLVLHYSQKVEELFLIIYLIIFILVKIFVLE